MIYRIEDIIKSGNLRSNIEIQQIHIFKKNFLETG